MSHVRTQIRDAVAGAVTSLATVYKSRHLPIEEADLPSILVYTNNETVEGDFQTLARMLEIVVEIVVQGTDLGAEFDPLIVSVETALNANSLGGLTQSMVLRSTVVDSRIDGAAQTGRARLTFEALYRTSFTDPESSI